jgi:hypothetical protein
MRPSLSLGAFNAALVALYFVPVWGSAALRALMSPYYGFKDGLQAAAAAHYREMFDLGVQGLTLTAQLLAGIKFVIASAFVAYLIDFARSLVIGREADRATLDITLLLAMCGALVWLWPALKAGDAAVIRTCATELLLLTGAFVVIVVERHITAPAEAISAAPHAARDRAAPARRAAAA